MRTVLEDLIVENTVDFARQKWRRGRDSWEALKWVLANDPEAGVFVGQSRLTRARTIHGARSISLPTVTALYTFDKDTVTIHDVHFTEAGQWTRNE